MLSLTTNIALITEVLLSHPPVIRSADTHAGVVCLRLSSAELQLLVDQQILVQLNVSSVGVEVARVMHSCRKGRVVAVFERSFYVQSDHGLICVGLNSLGEGPMHCLIAPDCHHLPAKITVGLSVFMLNCLPPSDKDLKEQDTCFSENENRQWYDGVVTGKPVSAFSIDQCQRVLAVVVPPRQQGFGWTIVQPHGSDIAEVFEGASLDLDAVSLSLYTQCSPALNGLFQWLDDSLTRPDEQRVSAARDNMAVNAEKPCVSDHEVPRHVSELLGAGPGLTPAGDDLLAGAMLALYRIEHGHLAFLLWTLLQPWLACRTNVISASHLCLAAKGQCSAAVLDLLDCVFREENRINTGCEKNKAAKIEYSANQIGASSGWDLLAGMNLVLRAL